MRVSSLLRAQMARRGVNIPLTALLGLMLTTGMTTGVEANFLWTVPDIQSYMRVPGHPTAPAIVTALRLMLRTQLTLRCCGPPDTLLTASAALRRSSQ